MTVKSIMGTLIFYVYSIAAIPFTLIIILFKLGYFWADEFFDGLGRMTEAEEEDG